MVVIKYNALDRNELRMLRVGREQTCIPGTFRMDASGHVREGSAALQRHTPV